MATKTDSAPRRSLEQSITQAFRTERPQRLVFGQAWEDEDIEKEFASVTTWAGNGLLLGRFHDALANFNASAFLWILPGYLTTAIEMPESQVADSLIDHLAGRDAGSVWKNRLAIMTPDQRRVVRQALTYLSRHRLMQQDRAMQEALRKWAAD